MNDNQEPRAFEITITVVVCAESEPRAKELAFELTEPWQATPGEGPYATKLSVKEVGNFDQFEEAWLNKEWAEGHDY